MLKSTIFHFQEREKANSFFFGSMKAKQLFPFRMLLQRNAPALLGLLFIGETRTVR